MNIYIFISQKFRFIFYLFVHSVCFHISQTSVHTYQWVDCLYMLVLFWFESGKSELALVVSVATINLNRTVDFTIQRIFYHYFVDLRVKKKLNPFFIEIIFLFNGKLSSNWGTFLNKTKKLLHEVISIIVRFNKKGDNNKILKLCAKICANTPTEICLKKKTKKKLTDYWAYSVQTWNWKFRCHSS